MVGLRDVETVIREHSAVDLACGFEPYGYVEHDFRLGSKQLHLHIDLTEKEGES